jgi:hypothetical protein
MIHVDMLFGSRPVHAEVHAIFLNTSFSTLAQSLSRLVVISVHV